MQVKQKKLVIVAGLSGSGKSATLSALEDFGYYCVDNLPIALLPAFASDLVANEHPRYAQIALTLDVRDGADDLRQITPVLEMLSEQGVNCEMFALHAQDQVLLKRYSETRRRHPLTNGDRTLADAISLERQLLEPFHLGADLLIDTSQVTLRQLRDLVRQKVEQSPGALLSLAVESFGFKHGLPDNADYLFDARCLPNPHWQPELRPLTGRDEAVASFLQADSQVRKMLGQIIEFLESWMPCFEREGRSYLTIAIGCTGGCHRSVFMAESIARHFREQGRTVLLRHRELTP